MALTMSRLTREYVKWPIITDDDISQSTAKIAFIDNAIDLPEENDWKNAEVIEESDGWKVRVLVGPDHVNSVDLTPPTANFIDYEAWVRLTDSPERIVRRPGVITIL